MWISLAGCKHTARPRLARGLPLPAGTKSRAWFSRCERYRYLLIRELAYPSPEERKRWHVVLFVLLNPSSASHLVDDRTIAKCWRLTRRWGGTEMRICNVYGLRATSPRDLWRCKDPIGPRRDAWLRRAAIGFASARRAHGPAHRIVVAWGNHAREADLESVRVILREAAAPVFALRTTARRAPQHPLYLPEHTRLAPY